VDYAQLVKLYGATSEGAKGRYSPAEYIGSRKERVEGSPDPKHISTSYAERQNLTMRMQMRRFTRLTNAFSKKFENHMHMVALYTVWYNFVRMHKSLKSISPAMAAGMTTTLWNMTDLAEMIDAAQPKPGRRAPYKKTGGENSNRDPTSRGPASFRKNGLNDTSHMPMKSVLFSTRATHLWRSNSTHLLQ
jgi:hypothetical protein